MTSADAVLRPVGIEPIGMADRAQISIDDARFVRSCAQEILADGGTQIHVIAAPEHTGTEGISEDLVDIRTHLEAFLVDVRADIDIARCKRFLDRDAFPRSLFLGQGRKRADGDMPLGATPAGVGHGESPGRRHQDERDAISEAEQREHIRRVHEDSVSLRSEEQIVFGCLRRRIKKRETFPLAFFGGADDIRPMDLLRVDEDHARSPHCIHEVGDVRPGSRFALSGEPTQVEGAIGRAAQASSALREADGHPTGSSERIIRKKANA